MDREFDETGFTGVETLVPVRSADVEVLDANAAGKKAIIGSGATDSLGNYSFLVQDTKVRDVFVRVITRSDETPDLNVDVRADSGAQPVHYAAATATVAGHAPSVNLDFGAAVIQIGQGGEAFNIYSQMLTGTDYLAFLTGSRPVTHLATVWGENNGVGGSYYSASSTRIILRDSAGYDDTVVLHEMGHFVIREYSNTDTTSDPHTFSWCDLDLRLAFDEGFASYFGNSALRHQGRPRSNIYTRTTGGPGSGHLVRFADLESDAQYLCQGSTSEVNVFTVLWDIVDGPSTPDSTPGVDDPHDLLDLDETEVWEVFTNYLPAATSVTMEDFWDGWFLPPVLNGFRTEMLDLAAHVGIEYIEDSFEENNSVIAATPILVGAPPLHATFFLDEDLDGAGAADDDYFSFVTDANSINVIETLNLLSDGNTKLYLIDSDGTTVLAINDNRVSGDDSSFIEWTAPSTGTFFVRVTHALDSGIYGSYDLKVSPLITIDDDIDGFDVTLDCDDNNYNVNPGVTELCNGIDDNCNTLVDEGFDQDEDEFTTCAGDCDDGYDGVNPAASEIASNGVDDNCNGVVDEVVGTGGSRKRRMFLKPALD
jgi:hypothetical protein